MFKKSNHPVGVNMEKIDEFLKILNEYEALYNILFEKHKTSFEQQKISLIIHNNDEITIGHALEIVRETKKEVQFLKDQNKGPYMILDSMFTSASNAHGSIFKTYINAIPGKQGQKTDQNLEKVLTDCVGFTTAEEKNKVSFDEAFLSGRYYFENLKNILCVCFWLKTVLSMIIPADEEIKKQYVEQLSKNEGIVNLINEGEYEQIKSLIEISRKSKTILDTINLIESTGSEIPLLKQAMRSTESEMAEIKENLKNQSKQTDDLIKENKNLSMKLASKEMSGTFHEASEYYKESLKNQRRYIFAMFIAFLLTAGVVMFTLKIDTIISLKDSPLTLLIYTSPRILAFLICSWALKFLISEYRSNTKNSLNFKHKQAVADSTPAFRNLVTDDEKNHIVSDAFKVLLNQEENDVTPISEDYHQLILDLKSMTDNQRKNFFSLINISSRNKKEEKPEE